MDRVFLDANVLSSAAYKPGTALAELWKLTEAQLVTSAQAVSEAYVNLSRSRPGQLHVLSQLLQAVAVVPDPPSAATLPSGVELPQKDEPILLAAIHCKATHLLTGDVTHFGRYFGQTLGGVLILPPGDYLRSRKS